jgi:predicted negative regulator of RcsB-dependent stress response
MSQLPPAGQPVPHADPAATPAAERGFEVEVHAFWQRNRSYILLACLAGLLAIAGREGVQYFSASHEKSVQDDYARAAEKPETLLGFADANSNHALAGVAYLQVADRKFEAADYAQAATLYAKAATSLKNEALLGRARLGAAISQLNGGDRTAAEAALKAIGSDTTLHKSIRAEATYHLASLALEAGRTDEVRKLVEDITKVDLAGAWAQRGTMLLANLPAGAAPDKSVGGLILKP